MNKLFLCFSMILFSCTIYAMEVRTTNVNFGKVIGEVNNGYFQTKQNLKVNTVFMFDSEKSGSELKVIVIKNTSITKVQNDTITLETTQNNMGGSMRLNYRVNLFCDGEKVVMRVLQVGRDAKILIENGCDIVKLDVINPVTVDIEHNFKGEFTMNLDIEGRGR